MYKIVAKMLTNRLKKILTGLASEEQSKFVRGMLITDNDIITYECVNSIKRRKRKKLLCAMKLDNEGL